MNNPDLFEEMLSTYPAENRELARQVYQRFADGDSTQFFTQLLLVLDVYARYVEHIPKATVQAQRESFAILEDTREEISLMAKTIETRDVNLANNTAKINELCKITQAKCNETVASVELLVKNLGAQMDTKAIVQGIQAALDKGVKAEIISPFIQHSRQLEKEVLPTLKEIKAAATEARTLWMQHIWKTAWAGSFLITFTLFMLALVGISHWLDLRDQRELAARIAGVSRLMDNNQAAFRGLAVAGIAIQVKRVGNGDVLTPQGFAIVVPDAYTTEMQDMDGHHNGITFVTSATTEREIQELEKAISQISHVHE